MNRPSTLALALALAVTAFGAPAQHAAHPAAPAQAPLRTEAPPPVATTTRAGHRRSTHAAPPGPSPTGLASPAVGNGMPSMLHDVSTMPHSQSATHDAPRRHQGTSHDMPRLHHDTPTMPHAMQGMTDDAPALHRGIHDDMPSTPHAMPGMHHGMSTMDRDSQGTTHDAPTTHHGAPPDASPRPQDVERITGDASTLHHGMHHDMSPHAMPGMDHAMPHDMSTVPAKAAPAGAAPRTPVPEPTDADRAAAFPALGDHPAHDRARFGFLRVDRLERDDDGGAGWEAIGWYGGDIHRAWLRTEGHAAGGRVEDASVELLYGRLVAPWWDAVAGLRQDAGDGPSRRWAAFGVQGVAPYKFEVRATAYVGAGGRTAARLEGEYDTLLTNRAVLQWRAEADLYGRDDAARGLGRGLSTVGAGLRLRYEITRRVAPYLGVEHERAYGRTATLRRGDGDAARDTRVVAGLRLAF